jgi:bifunctional non-homologous end joining protein LigD
MIYVARRVSRAALSSKVFIWLKPVEADRETSHSQFKARDFGLFWVMAKKEYLTIDRRKVPVSNLHKVLFPGGRVTKAQVIDYYLRVSRWILPHLKDRPVTLKRYPNGVTGEHFYEKDAPGFTPDWVKTFPVPRREAGAPGIRYILINDRATVAWLANLANLEIHPFLHRVPHIDRPTWIVFDLDPGAGANILACGEVAFILRDVLSQLGMQSFVKVSGSKGLQVYVPLNTDVNYAQTQPFAKAIADLLAERHPELIVAEMAKVLRQKKVFIDWSQNADFKTTAGVYSLRAKKSRPFVSAPVQWEELDAAMKDGDADSLFFGMDETIDRLERLGDLFKPVLTIKQNLPSQVTRHLATRTPRSLERYTAKRNFSKTQEPAPSAVRRSSQGSRRRFVIQKHAASHLHYDFRLEMHEVLKSWAVPKGPPYGEGERRLAMPTEDHPLDYFDFEGIIPKAQYGGGTVMVWDIGTYEPLEGNYYKGYLRIHLNGRKLKGEWELVRSKDKDRDVWFLVKTARSMRPISKKRDDTSALSSRSMREIAEAADATWNSNRTGAA